MNYGTIPPMSPEELWSRSFKRKASRVELFLGAVLLLAVCGLVALSMQTTTFSPQSKLTVVKSVGGKHSSVRAHMKQLSAHSQILDDEAEAPADAGAESEEVFSWETFGSVFGWHLGFLVFVVLVDIGLWVYVRFIRPQTWFQEFIKKSTSLADGFAPPTVDGSAAPAAYRDENDIPGSLTLVPGEAVFFNEEVALSFGGIFGTCSKLSVTNFRLIAQKSDTTLLGTCMLQSYEDAWPISNVSKVRLCTGEFYGLTVSSLIYYTFLYFFLAGFSDFAQYFLINHVEILYSLEPYLPGALILIVFKVLGNLFVALAMVCAFATAFLIIFPQTLLKVFLTRKMEDKSHMYPWSVPMENFTFQTSNAYRAYQAIFAAQTGKGTGKDLQFGAFNEIPAGIYTKTSANFVAADAAKK